MRFAFAAFVLAHAVAHLVGFLGSWKLSSAIPYKSTIVGGIDIGDAAIRTMGILWLMTALSFAACAAGVLMRTPWWPMAVLIVSAASLALSIAALPDSIIGVPINLFIMGIVALALHNGWELVR